VILHPQSASGNRRGSVLVIVLWVALGLVAITLYFANATGLELRAAENRVAGIQADQAIEGAARYVAYVLASQATNGYFPDLQKYLSQAVQVGETHFWIIGRAGDETGEPDQAYFSLVDEASKLNLNTATAEMLEYLTNMTPQLAANIYDWRSTNTTPSANGDGPTVYARLNPPYTAKAGPYESVEELRLVYGMTPEILDGEDLNRNGALDPSESDLNRNTMTDTGLVDYFTVWTREPLTKSDGTSYTNIGGGQQQLAGLLEEYLSTQRANEILRNIGTNTLDSELKFYIVSRMTQEEFEQIAGEICVGSSGFIEGRVNVNTASSAVLSCIPGIGPDRAAQLVNYRLSNAGNLASIAWVKEALNNDEAAIEAGPYLTTRSYQFTADIAAIGHNGLGYRRQRFIFDMSEGTPKIIYRRDLSHLGWALGKTIRQVWLTAKETR
jgi:type II secretory pathway component PulK